MKKFIVITGPQAVGKMTVGHEIEKLTGFKVFHNHVVIEMVDPFLSYGTKEGRKLVDTIRDEMFDAIASSNMPGLIFTFVWAFGQEGEKEYVDKVCKIFENKGSDIYIVELEADIDARLARNVTPHRLEHKPSKRDIEFSRNNLLESNIRYRLNSTPGEITRENYIRINNTKLSAEEVAKKIVEEFELEKK